MTFRSAKQCAYQRGMAPAASHAARVCGFAHSAPNGIGLAISPRCGVTGWHPASAMNRVARKPVKHFSPLLVDQTSVEATSTYDTAVGIPVDNTDHYGLDRIEPGEAE